jgi:hypothetical protein
MTRIQIVGRTAAVALLATALTGTSTQVHANGGSAGSTALLQARAIEGAWEPTVTIRDCQTGAPLFSFLSVDSYIRGGSFIGEGMGEPPNRALGAGTWQHAGGRNFTATYQFFAYNPDGTPLGRLRVSSKIRLSTDGESFRTSDTAQLSDLNGTVLQDICGTREARRLR